MAKDTGGTLDKRQKRRKRIKTAIIILAVTLLVLPLMLSVFLMFRVSRLENRLDELISRSGLQAQKSVETPDIVEAEAKPGAVSGAAATVEEPQKAKKVYLTFDDGPSRETEKILDVLKEKDVKATFFVIGRDDQFSKKIYKRIVEEGHTLGMHSYSHILTEIYASMDAFQKDFNKLYKLLLGTTGVQPEYYRFPGGSKNTVNQLPVDQYKTFLADQGVSYQDWNVIAANSTTDQVSRKEMVKSILDGVSQYATSIVLLYDSADKKMTAKSLGTIIDRLREGGYELLPIDEGTTPVQHS